MKRTLKVLGAILVMAILLSGINICVFAAGDVAINATNFPDENFRKYVSEKFDEDKNGEISLEEITSVDSLDIRIENIASLKGIEYFTGLTELYCSENKLITMDISKNTLLKTLHCQRNQLTSLDTSKNLALEELDCSLNQLNTLNVSCSTGLRSLYCSENKLTTLDISKNTALETLYCEENQLISLDISKNPALNTLVCYSNKLITLDVSGCSVLTNLVKGYRRQTYRYDYDFFRDEEPLWDTDLYAPLSIDKTVTVSAGVFVSSATKSVSSENESPSNPASGLDMPVAVTLPQTITLNVGETVQLAPVISPTDATTTFTYKSAKASVAKVDGNGLITSVKAGSTKITVTTANKKSATVTVKVTDPKPTKITITQGKKYTLKVGKTLKLKYKLTPSNAKTTLKWKSSKKIVATVNAKTGVVKAKKAGTAKITVTTGNKKKATITIKVKK